MSEIVAIVEGQTEQTFVIRQLAAHLGLRGIAIWARLSGKTGKLGGVKKWESARNDIIRTLKEGRYCTTMFDYYGMPHDWPGREGASKLPWDQRGSHVESKIHGEIAMQMGANWNPKRFLPYVQVHEFEALLFSDTEQLAAIGGDARSIRELFIDVKDELDKIVGQVTSPEAIDDGQETCPSRRIKGLIRGYIKRLHGPIAADRIGIEKLRIRCPHFGAWVEKLEGLGHGQS